MLNRRALMASATALPLTSIIPAAWAATPKDTVVFAGQIDGLITFDPGEAYELAGADDPPAFTTGSCATRPRT